MGTRAAMRQPEQRVGERGQAEHVEDGQPGDGDEEHGDGPGPVADASD